MNFTIAAEFVKDDGSLEIKVYDFVPKRDITAYEGVLIMQQIVYPDIKFLSDHPELMRHFVEK